ncbi:hypothetical protein GCM10010129_47710 [Streptomyces fumigatiscleroticus]|nr:hypothetical protein GCM10010129_47710 [Streptomyces fumigatiscleroticus]
MSDELPPEAPALAQSISEAMSDKGLSREEIAEMAGFSDADRNTLFVVSTRRLRAV